MATEKWVPAPIEGLEKSYEVSNLGGVRSLDREVETSSGILRCMRGRVLVQSCNTSGDPMVKLSAGGQVLSISVKKLVMQAFRTASTEIMDTIRHHDGNIANNKYSNLYYAPRGKSN